MANPTISRLLALCLIPLLVSCTESNNKFSITEFKVVKNGTILLQDKFSGTPLQLTDATPSNTAGYELTGQLAAPKNLKQILTYVQAIADPTNANVMHNIATLKTDIAPANHSAGLKPGMTFEISGTFDMIVPDNSGPTYYIGLSDKQSTSGDASTAPAKDTIMLGYTLHRVGTGGMSMVYFRSTDASVAAPGNVINQTYAIMNPDGQQIKLRLRKADAAVNRITASYALIKNGIVGPYIDLPQTMSGAAYMPIFREHAYTRPFFGATWPKRRDEPEFTFPNVIATLLGKQPSKLPPKEPVIPSLSSIHPHAKEELIAFDTRNTKARALLTYETGKAPPFIAVMIPGGKGDFRFKPTPDGISMVNETRLQNRLRPLLLQRGIASALLDAPDDNPEMRLSYRESAEHLADLKAALAEIEKRFPGVPLVLIGHSIGSWSAVYLTAVVPKKIAATVLVESVLVGGDVLNLYDANKKIGDGLSAYDWNKVTKPLMLIHHKKDDCIASPYAPAFELSQRIKRIRLLAIDTEKEVSTGYCGSGPHNLDEHEVLVADSIMRWVAQQKIKTY